jgi:hypothetical protein
MSYEITGNLIEKYPTVEVSGKFRKREFVISRTEMAGSFEFNDFIKFQLTQDRCSLLDSVNIQDEVKVNFNLRGRKWEKDGALNYFTNLEAWKVEKVVSGNSSSNTSSQQPSAPMPGEDDLLLPTDDTGDLPF